MSKHLTEKRPVAIYTIRNAGKMTKAERKIVADWMRSAAKLLERYGSEYASVFTGRIIGHPKKDLA